jgi:hypothetical protein
MNAREFLVTTVHEIAISTKLAIPARASEKADLHALTNRPALDTGAKGIDPPDHFMPWHARPANGKEAFYRARIRVAHTASLDAKAYLMGPGIQQWLSYVRELSRFRDLYRSVCCVHIASDCV